MESTFVRKDIIQEIELPKSLFVWVLDNVRRPIAGFEHKRGRAGAYISYNEQVSETQYQLLLIASDYYKKGVPPERIKEVMMRFIQADF